jgi:hypothetical protein
MVDDACAIRVLDLVDHAVLREEHPRLRIIREAQLGHLLPIQERALDTRHVGGPAMHAPGRALEERVDDHVLVELAEQMKQRLAHV